ncbi:diguanylate cyclase domain-containing protein [Sphingomonas sp. MMS24-JH45]
MPRRPDRAHADLPPVVAHVLFRLSGPARDAGRAGALVVGVGPPAPRRTGPLPGLRRLGLGPDREAPRRRRSHGSRCSTVSPGSPTGSGNRFALEQSLSPQSGQGVTGLFLLDLDRFKSVDDTQGHQVGDELLKQVAYRLQRTVANSGLVGRLGGDDFQVIVPREDNPAVLAVLADAIIAALSEPYSSTA